MDGNTRRNMKHLIEIFESRVNTGEEEDAADIADIEEDTTATREAYNLAMGIYTVQFYCRKIYVYLFIRLDINCQCRKHLLLQ